MVNVPCPLSQSHRRGDESFQIPPSALVSLAGAVILAEQRILQLRIENNSGICVGNPGVRSFGSYRPGLTSRQGFQPGES